MSRLRNLVKGNPLETKAGMCICGLRMSHGKCRHCDGPCDTMLRSVRGCKRCAKNVQNFFHKDYIRDQYFAFIDEDVLKGSAQIRIENFKNDYPDFLKPDGDQ